MQTGQYNGGAIPFHDAGIRVVLDVVYNQDTNMSDMCVFNAQDIAAGPIGRAKVSHRVPVSFHGTWRQAV